MTLKSERFEMRLDEITLERIDAWRHNNVREPISRAEAVRRLVEKALSAEEVSISDGERLTIAMLADIQKFLNMPKGEIDPSFVMNCLYGGHSWALHDELTGLLHGHTVSRTTVNDVINILDMWMFIEDAITSFNADERREFEAAEKTLATSRFAGFDGNNEFEHLSISRFFIDELKRFQHFEGRYLNSHSPVLGRYLKMYERFEPMRARLIGVRLSVKQVIDILSGK
jgi:uncharacterized protein YfbU (UPF0304 family)